MLKDIGVKWVIIGHSERRSLFGENDEVRLFTIKLNSVLIDFSTQTLLLA